MRVIHVVPSVSQEASGTSYAVTRLCETLIEGGTEAGVATLSAAEQQEARPYLMTFPTGVGPRRLGVSPGLRRWLADGTASRRFDIVHNHGLWMMPNVYPGLACRQTRCRLLVSPHGTLSRWALGVHGLRKRVFWHLWQERALRATDCFHATAQHEYEDIRRLGYRQPVCLLPNGIDVPPLQRCQAGDRRRLLFLSRLHAGKGLDILLRAWRAVQDRFTDWDLHVAGPDDRGCLAAMRALTSQLGVERVTFEGPVYGDAKWQAFRAASLFVLPSRSENFGMAVAEALAAGTPAIVSNAAPWRALPARKAGWSIDIGVDPLVGCLQRALALSPEQLTQMGLAGREWMLREYSWQTIAARWLATYRWLITGGETPACVRVN